MGSLLFSSYAGKRTSRGHSGNDSIRLLCEKKVVHVQSFMESSPDEGASDYVAGERGCVALELM